MKLRKLTQLTALSAAFVGAASFAASNDALLDLLVKKGVLTDQEATAVAAELQADAPVYVTAKGKAVDSIKLTGRVHFQYDSINNDNGDNSEDGFFFRRLYLGAEAKFFENYYAKLIANYSDDDGDIDIDKAIVGWKYSSAFTGEAGYQKAPFGFYETTSSSKIKTVERSIANRYFVEGDGIQLGGRHTGLFAKGDLGGGFGYKAAIVQSVPSNTRNDNREDDNRGFGGFARVQWESEEFDNGGQLMLGADLAFMQDGNRFIGNGAVAQDSDLIAYGIHGQYSLGDFLLSAEALATTVDDVVIGANTDDVDVFGFTVVPSYKINDQWELVGQYSYIDSDDANLLDIDNLVRRSNVTGDYNEGVSYYIGFNYYIKGNDLKLTGGYELSEFEANGGNDVEVDTFRLRLQALF
jgi:hypothetical protein